MPKRKITEKLIKVFEQNMREDEKSDATIEKYLRDLQSICTNILYA